MAVFIQTHPNFRPFRRIMFQDVDFASHLDHAWALDTDLFPRHSCTALPSEVQSQEKPKDENTKTEEPFQVIDFNKPFQLNASV